MTRVTRLIHNAGKYLLISIYPLPTHPTHLTWLLGGMVYWKNWIRLRDAKKHTIKVFWWFKGDLISQWIPKFYLCGESNPINPQCGKIFANFYISPPHPPHSQFYPQKWWKFRYTSRLTPKNWISIDLRRAQVNNTELWCFPWHQWHEKTVNKRSCCRWFQMPCRYVTSP